MKLTYHLLLNFVWYFRLNRMWQDNVVAHFNQIIIHSFVYFDIHLLLEFRKQMELTPPFNFSDYYHQTKCSLDSGDEYTVLRKMKNDCLQIMSGPNLKM